MLLLRNILNEKLPKLWLGRWPSRAVELVAGMHRTRQLENVNYQLSAVADVVSLLRGSLGESIVEGKPEV